MKRTTWFVIGAVAAASAGVPAALASQSRPSPHITRIPADFQKLVWRDRPVSTTDTHFLPVPGLRSVLIPSGGAVSVQLSAELSGDPLLLRMRRYGPAPQILHPGTFRLSPGLDDRFFTFTFTSERSDRPCVYYGAEWRSATGGRATIERGTVVLTYRGPNRYCGTP